MKSNYLFPNSFKLVGWIIFIPALFIGIYFVILEFDINFIEIPVFAIVQDEIFSDVDKNFVWIKNDIGDELLAIFLIIGALLVSFSKLKHEDEFIMKIRLDALMWATYINYLILILAIIFIYGFPFLTVLLINMVTLLLLFILRFHWMLYKNLKTSSNEE